VVLFGKHPARRFPQVRIRAARFKGADTVTDFSDNRIFEGNAFELIESAEQFLRAHIAIASELPIQGVRRADTPAYPWRALREAVLNAIVHRDYASFDGGLSLAIYDDRIEIWNSGSLPSGITVESLKGPHPSRPHNPDIANVMFLRGYIERWGLGTRMILSRCLDSGLPEPEWLTDSGGVTLIIRLTPKSKGTELNSRKVGLLRKLKTGERILPSDYFALVSSEAKERRARQDLLEMSKAGYLRREGKGPATAYIRTTKPIPKT
jgi:ATP-dependent DNA helicase RecG